MLSTSEKQNFFSVKANVVYLLYVSTICCALPEIFCLECF